MWGLWCKDAIVVAQCVLVVILGSSCGLWCKDVIVVGQFVCHGDSVCVCVCVCCGIKMRFLFNSVVFADQ